MKTELSKHEFIDKMLQEISFSEMYELVLGDGYNNTIYEMDELDEIFRNEEPLNILRSAYFGYDYNNGNNTSVPFDPNSEYFLFNGYANLVSISEYEVKILLPQILVVM